MEGTPSHRSSVKPRYLSHSQYRQFLHDNPLILTPPPLPDNQRYTRADLAAFYRHHILEGYNLSVAEVMQILMCSRDFVEKWILPRVQRIYITTLLRRLLLEFEPPREIYRLDHECEDIEEYVMNCYTKRRLMHRAHFWYVMRESGACIKTFSRIYWHECTDEVYQNKDPQNKQLCAIQYQLEKAYHKVKVDERTTESAIHPADWPPGDLVSMKHLMSIKKKHAAPLREAIYYQAIPRYKWFGNLVRYRVSDLQPDMHAGLVRATVFEPDYLTSNAQALSFSAFWVVPASKEKEARKWIKKWMKEPRIDLIVQEWETFLASESQWFTPDDNEGSQWI